MTLAEVPIEWQVAAAIGALAAALLVANRGMALGVFVMMFGANVRSPVIVVVGALWAYLMTPEKPEGGDGGSGQQRHA